MSWFRFSSRRRWFLLGGLLLLAALFLWWRNDDGLNVPLGVEQAAIITYGGPKLEVRPFRWGVAVNVRIAQVTDIPGAKVYDVRYLVNRAGEHDLTAYLMGADGAPAEGLPSFKVRGDPKLSKELEARVRETEAIDIEVPGHYRATLAGLGVLWVGWLLLLIFYGRKRPAPPAPAMPPPTLREEILALVARMERDELDVPGRARLEMLLLRAWREEAADADSPMSAVLAALDRDERKAAAWQDLQRWLHRPGSGVAAAPLAAALREHLPSPGSTELPSR